MIQCKAISKSTKERCKKEVIKGKKYCKDHTPRFSLGSYSVKLTILFGILGVGLFFFGGDIIDLYTGYRLEINFKEEEIYHDYRLDEDFVKIEVTNVGGYPLKDISGKLSFHCKGKDVSEYGEGFFLEPVSRINKRETKALLFDNATLVKYIKNQDYCADADLFIFKFQNEDSEWIIKDKILFTLLPNKTIEKKIIDKKSFTFSLCVDCQINISIIDEELRRFDYNKTHIFTNLYQFKHNEESLLKKVNEKVTEDKDVARNLIVFFTKNENSTIEGLLIEEYFRNRLSEEYGLLKGEPLSFTKEPIWISRTEDAGLILPKFS